MKILLHVCCAQCSIEVIDFLIKNNFNLTLFWFNPNIHPLTEYLSRKNALINYAKSLNLKLIVNECYGLRKFILNLNGNFNERCFKCYETRLFETAKFAKENSFDCFSTTLLISPFQQHDLIKQLASNMAEKVDVNFFYQDFRPKFKIGQQKARELGIYMQKFCGCIFSEEERFQKKLKK